MSATLPELKDLTPAWLEDLLQASGIEAKLSRVDAVPIGTGQVGATYRLTLGYLEKPPGAPETLIAKLPSNDPLSKATGKSHLTYIRESRFYQLFAGTRPLPVPDHLFIAFDDDTHDFALIMHDLPRHRAGNQLHSPTPLQARLAIGAAADIHAAWWGDPMLDALDWLNGTKAVPPPLDVEAIYKMFWPAFCDRYGDRVTPEMKRVGEAYLDNMGAWVNGHEGPRCLTHNDFRPDNMLFDLEDQSKPIVIVDWQTVGVGSGAGDVAYFMGTSLERDRRQAEEQALFAHYKDRLIKNGVPERDTDDLWDVYRTGSFAGFLMGVTASMVVGQTDRGDDMFLTMCSRSAAMVIDHADVALF